MPTSLSFDLELAGPLDVPASLELFRSSGDDLIDRWNGVNLIRTMPAGGSSVACGCAVTGGVEQPTLRVTVTDPAHARPVEQGVRSSFMAAPPEFCELVKIDPVIAKLDARFRGLRLVRQLDLLAALIRCISAQQVNLRWAVITRRRLAEAFGDKHTVNDHAVYSLNAKRLAAATVADIRALQFTTRKAEYIIGVAEAVVDGLSVSELAKLPDDEVLSRLTRLRGIGVWTAEWILARTLGRPRVVAGDLGVRKAVSLAYLDTALAPEHAVRRATAHWGSSAGLAQTLLLYGLQKNMLRE